MIYDLYNILLNWCAIFKYFIHQIQNEILIEKRYFFVIIF